MKATQNLKHGGGQLVESHGQTPTHEKEVVHGRRRRRKGEVVDQILAGDHAGQRDVNRSQEPDRSVEPLWAFWHRVDLAVGCSVRDEHQKVDDIGDYE